ncbi:ROK family protein [Salipaludibacillus sp. CUR1]|uniref:ROK family protein n=1 Tax=Salipaludibacillus sp. CUR1 TaxID=2820003 RepID=UPI001E5E8B54|nr:ROK family protein [Salipaludibacillus sp. CUR1]
MKDEIKRIGIDIGGTSIKAGLINDRGDVVDHREIETPNTPEEGINTISEMTADWQEEAEEAVGVAAPGPMDLARGLFLDPPNLPGWHDFPFVDAFEKKTEMKCLFENDANAAAVGEYIAGAGRDAKSLVYITISTGIGAGIVLNGQLLSGAQFSAGEVGNMIISEEGAAQAGLNQGAWESLASGTAVKKKVKEVFGLEEGAKDLLQLVEKKDAEALRIFDRWIGHLASGIANIVHVINPEMIVLGGGVMQGKEIILPHLKPAVKRKVYASLENSVMIEPARLGTKTGVIGASFLPLIQRL